jgi:Ca2+/Na+ antiporter
LLLAPFPWQFGSFRQMLTLPEMVVWWCAIPLLALGAWFTIKHRLREIAPIIIFTSLLTLTYSIVQGNVGTAYRQRAQLLVFYFIFVAVGFVLVREKRDNERRKKQAEREAERRPRPRPDRVQDQMPAVG